MNLDGMLLPEDALAAAGHGDATKHVSTRDRTTAFFETFRGAVFRYLMRKCGDPLLSEDLVQEVFLRLYRYLDQGNTMRNPTAWLFTVAGNLVVDAGRGKRTDSDLDQEAWSKLEDSQPAIGPDPEQLILQRERLDRIHRALLSLTSLQRQCLHLRAEGLRYREIAELLDLSISTVAAAVRRGLLTLAAHMNGEEQR